MTLLHQAAQKAVEAKQREAFEHWYSDAGRWPKSVARSEDGHYLLAQTNSSYEAWRAALSALQQQPEPVARSAHMCGMQGFDGMLDICPACEARRAPPALQHQEVPREPVAADGFNGDTPNLVRSITALLELDAAGAMAGPHMGGHARTLLTAAANRLAASPSTTRQQEVGSFDKTGERINALAKEAGFHMEPMTNMLYTVRGNHAQLVNFARLVLAAAPSTPEKAGGVTAPAALRLPEPRKLPKMDASYSSNSTYFRGLGWNECLDELKRLNAPGVPVPVSQPKAPSGTDGGSHPLPAQANDGGEHA